MENNNETYTEELVLISEKVDVNNNVVLYNDDVNTFDYVIESLIKICKHDLIQAEQCTYLVHYKGRCAVKAGSFSELKPIQEALGDRGLTAAIE
ncbi:MAG: ATP-dependent Clp protease adaptor ClpS [Bacteroidetes bacterium]|nr:ATP-dependent Clp protease adaptor ClpS [Bacteroidota bacterium]